MLKHLGGLERKVVHDTVRLLTGSAAGWLDLLDTLTSTEDIEEFPVTPADWAWSRRPGGYNRFRVGSV